MSLPTEGAGLIFVYNRDPIGRLCTRLSGDNFSTLGIYYHATVTGSKRCHLLLSDIYGFYQRYPSTTLAQWLEDPLINDARLVRYRGDEGKFRAVIANIITDINKETLRDKLYRALTDKRGKDYLKLLIMSILGPELFTEEEGIILEERHPVSVELSMIKAVSDQRGLFQKLAGALVDMFLADRNFFDKLEIKANPSDEHNEASLLTLVTKWLKDKCIDLRTPDCSHYGPAVKYNLVDADDFKRSLDNLRQYIEDINSSIVKSKPIVLNINKLIQIYNSLDLSSDRLPLIESESSYGAIVSTTDTDAKIIVNCDCLAIYNPDLTDYDRATLIEILEYLDSLNDSKYDALRINITAKLAELERV